MTHADAAASVEVERHGKEGRRKVKFDYTLSCEYAASMLPLADCLLRVPIRSAYIQISLQTDWRSLTANTNLLNRYHQQILLF